MPPDHAVSYQTISLVDIDFEDPAFRITTRNDIDDLLGGFEWPDAVVRCYLDLDSQTRKGLGRAGFVEEALLAAPLRRSTGEAVDILVMRRAGNTLVSR